MAFFSDFLSYLSWMLETSNLFWKIVELKKIFMAQMIDFFTKPFLKDAKNQSHKGGSPEAPKPLNSIQLFHP